MYKKPLKIIGVQAVILLIIVTIMYLVLIYKSIDINFYLLLFYSIKVDFIIICFVVLRKYRFKTIFVGLLLTSLALIYELFVIHQLIEETFTVYILFHKIFNLLGIIFMVYGLWVSLVQNNVLLGKLKHLAYYDSITNLPNRNFLLKYCPIKEVIHCTDKNCSECLLSHKELLDQNKKAILFIDIDDFKYINDNLGHSNGDILLKSIAERFKTCIHKDDHLIHLSGDEFLIVSSHFNDDIKSVTDRLFDVINEPYHINHIDVHITCSIGVSYYPLHGSSLEDLIQRADIAMYEAKKEGKNSYFVYKNDLEVNFTKRFELVNELINGIHNEEFVVYYQAKASIETGEITGLEALARWNHPTRGIIPPIEFIGLAEDSGLIKEIDTQVLRTVCKQINQWTSEGKKPYNISVNISPLFFMNRHFISTIDAIIDEYQINTEYISIEVTENVALNDGKQTIRIIEALKKRHIKVLLDDFGRGYSSFNYINEFKVDYIKIDKAFIDQISHNEVSQTLVNAIVFLSKRIGFKVIPEGVETEEQLQILKKLGCHEFQGYYLNKPQPIENINLKF